MFNVLFFGLDEKINSLLLGLVNGVFSIVMWIYEILMELALNPDSFFEITFINFSKTLYIIAGIFMVFRVVVGLLQMLVNPDQINDIIR